MPVDGKVRVHNRDGYVILAIDNPSLRNALTDKVLAILADEIQAADRDPQVRAILITGTSKVFASGADVRALATRSVMSSFDGSRVRDWGRIREVRTPTIAAVSGFCLGGGAELAMMCDIVIASPSAKFGLPETMLGLLPGAGGTQMLPRLVGKAIAMDMILAGRVLTANEALERGIVSRVSTGAGVLLLAEEVASVVAGRSAVAQKLAKQAVRASFETPLSAGIDAERVAFGMAIGSEDAREGIAAFLDKRPPRWTHA